MSTGIVQRRYRHFAWLHERLCDRYPFILMPPMPDKQVQGRFELVFIERRRRQLERYMNRIAMHPVLRSAPIFIEFLKAAVLPVHASSRETITTCLRSKLTRGAFDFCMGPCRTRYAQTRPRSPVWLALRQPAAALQRQPVRPTGP